MGKNRFDSDEEEVFFNIGTNYLDEEEASMNVDEHEIRSFRPGNINDSQKRTLPDAPGTGKVQMWRKNKTSKRRITVSEGGLCEISGGN